MKININGKIQSFETTSLSVSQLLQTLKVETPEMVSVQLNGRFVEKDLYETQMISDNDDVDFLYFLGGGAK